MTTSESIAVDLAYAVIIPVYNGVGTIERCLDALAQQTVSPAAYEIIVVDDGSRDATGAVVAAWIEAHPHLQARLVHQKNAGPGAARNRGAQQANAPVLLFTDADCAPAPDWIAALGAPFADAEVVGAKGAYLTRQSGLAPRFVQTEYEDRYRRMIGQPTIDFIDTYSAAYRRAIFLENGGFDPIFTTASVEDQEFSFRLAQKGYRMVFAPAARVYHIHDEHWREYFRRKYYIGYWKALLTRWHPERMVQDSHTPQVLKVQILLAAVLLVTLLLSPLGLVWPLARWIWLAGALALVAFLISAVPFLAQLAARSWALALIGPWMLLVRAVALGAGYVHGTIHFAGTVPGMRQPVIPGWKRMIKRTLDILGALAGLALTIPLVALAAVAIKLDSPGPIFFWQMRVGENGRPFRIVKLRSMVVDAEHQLDTLVDLGSLTEQPAFKLPHDPRVTRVGRFLRRTSLDEAPQFYNVLKGDMSLVGPRPEEERIVRLYQDQHRKRLAVKPGMTGPMQVSGRGNLSFADRLQLELDYIDNYSLQRDLVILVRTLPAIVHGNGAH